MKVKSFEIKKIVIGENMCQIFGYYICEKIKVPDWLGINKDIMLSVSGCFGGIHPDLSECFCVNDRTGEHIRYRKKWGLDDNKATMLQKDIGNIFGSSLAVDGRFLRFADAEYFYHTYFDKGSCVVVSVSTTEKYYGILISDLADYSGCKNDFLNDIVDEHDFLGYDILGWDISGFHTFLCNSLQNDLPYAKFNNLCLLQNDFNEVEKFVQEICDKGEPVEWVPCRIGKCCGDFDG